MRKVILLTVLTIVSSALSGQNLYSEIANSEDHTTFLELLEFIGLDSLLINDDYYSVFAPNNEAFESRYDAVALDSLKINDPAFLEVLLLNHFVADTVVIEFITEHYLPLSGSHFSLFVDAAANVLLYSLGTPTGDPNIYLSGTYNSNDLYTDFDNGRLFGLEQNVIHPNCQSTSEWYDVVIGPLSNILIQADWVDTLLNITTPVTFLCPASNDIYDHIDQNGGFNNTSFIDSLIRRHIINEYLPLQDIEGLTIAQNLLGEDLLFSKNNHQYYLDNSNEIRSFYDFKKSASLVLDSFLVEPIVSTTEQIGLEDFKVFPNPASDVVTVINSGTSNKSIVTIYTIDGKFIHKGEYFGAQVDINISNLKPGLYLLEYQNKFNLKRTKLLVF
jgi:uncharacterized surface protein with fasciclin (FAS1) repeats